MNDEIVFDWLRVETHGIFMKLFLSYKSTQEFQNSR